jgi:Pyruvate/2-oxoacid:ferredoxin oxidoreductase delta subunit
MPYAMMSVFFSSGTGNTYRVGCWFRELAEGRGVQVAAAEVERSDPRAFSPGPGVLLGLLHPTHGFTAPWDNISFALRLPRGRGTHAFVLATRAGTKLGPLFLPGMEGTAAYLVALLLLLRGYRVRGVTGLDMPSNWLAAHPGFSRPAAEAIIARARPRALSFLAGLLEGRRRYRGFICLALGVLLLQVSFMYLVLARFLLAKLFFADSRCTSCGLCADMCPRRAVRMWPPGGKGRGPARPYWTFSCASCMRCMAFCPTAAVEAGHSWMIVLAALTSVPLGLYLLIGLFPGAAGSRWLENRWVAFFLNYPFTLAMAAAAYLVFWALMRWPPANALFTRTTFTRVFRRYHEPETTIAELGRGGEKAGPA